MERGQFAPDVTSPPSLRWGKLLCIIIGFSMALAFPVTVAVSIVAESLPLSTVETVNLRAVAPLAAIAPQRPRALSFNANSIARYNRLATPRPMRLVRSGVSSSNGPTGSNDPKIKKIQDSKPYKELKDGLAKLEDEERLLQLEDGTFLLTSAKDVIERVEAAAKGVHEEAAEAVQNEVTQAADAVSKEVVEAADSVSKEVKKEVAESVDKVAKHLEIFIKTAQENKAAGAPQTQVFMKSTIEEVGDSANAIGNIVKKEVAETADIVKNRVQKGVEEVAGSDFMDSVSKQFQTTQTTARNLPSGEGTTQTGDLGARVDRTVMQWGLEAGLWQAWRSGEKSSTQVMKDLLSTYGKAYLMTSIVLSLISFAACYLLVKVGVDVPALLSKIGIAVTTTSTHAGIGALAYAAHKALSPIRFPPTIILTPLIARFLGQKTDEDQPLVKEDITPTTP